LTKEENTLRIRLFNATVLVILLTMLVTGSTTGISAQRNQPSGSPLSVSGPALAGDPTLESVSPSGFAAGVNMPVLITGQNLDGTSAALLGTVPLRNLEVVDSTQVSALVPWSIAPGTYDLTTTNQSGQTAVLAGAVTVSAPDSGWTSSGPWGGDLWDVVLDPVDPARLFVSAQRSGLFKSETGGDSWAMSLVTPFPLRTQIAYPTEGQPPAIYLTGDAGIGMLRSLDYGQTWETKVPEGFNDWQATRGFMGRAFVRSDEPSWVYLALSSSQDVDPNAGLYLSKDLGETWSLVDGTGGLHVTALALDPEDPDLNMVVGTQSGQVYTTTDGGSTWSDPNPVAEFIGRLVFAPHLYDGRRSLWAIANDSQRGEDDHAYLSTDGGANWAPVQVVPGATHCGVTYHDTIPGLLWAAVGSGYYSEDDGDTWNAIGPGLDQVQDLALVPGATSRQTTTLFAAISGGLYRSTDGGGTWQETDAGLGAVMTRTIAVSPFNADEAYAATQVKGIQHTLDGGRSWQSLSVPMGRYEASIAPDPFSDGKTFFGYGDMEPFPMVRISTDHGDTYVEQAVPLPPEYVDMWAYVSAITPDPSTKDRLLAGLCLDRTWPVMGPGLIYASIDGGSTWIQQSTPIGIKCVSRLTFDPQDADVVYAGTYGTGLLRSEDGGATWMPLAVQPAGTNIRSVAIDPRDALSIYVMSESPDVATMGVFVTQDGGESWVKMEGLTDYPIWELTLVRVGTGYRLYAATMNGLRTTSIPADPLAPWERGDGISETATIDGFNAGVEEGRVVLYIGTSGGTLPSSLASLASPARADSAQLVAGGVYRTMIRIYLAHLPLITR
jgi:photosystem II stability/assembly factor-like uncharacterized protein